MIRSPMLLLIAALATMPNLARADVQGTYRPGQAPVYQPKPSPPPTTQPQGERPAPAATYRPSMQPAPQRPSFSSPPQPPSKSYTPQAR